MRVNSLEQKQVSMQRYNHKRLEFQRRVLRFLIRHIGFNLLARLDHVEGLENVPAEGAAILMINHIAFVDPIVVLHLVPRNIVPMAKVEVYTYPVVGIFPRIWGVIPVRREEVDRRAIQMALDVLNAGEIILVAPEGTRSPQLQEGREGVAYLSSRSGAPIIPVAVEGSPGFPALRFTARWRKPGISVRFGVPFYYRKEYERAGREHLRKMTDEAMYALAQILPEHRRGVYKDLSNATQDTIEYR
ncbi:MAG: 1-acyl-sn-glycerol-3-phosphate acyltransferase [Chloroflexota bacterium]|nr:MAG: 1-acyl-sn-glycerol-3-phosphate acyltransferase [Chloroflexota bacterium]